MRPVPVPGAVEGRLLEHSPMNSGRLQVEDISVAFGGLQALDAVSMAAEPNQVTGLIGPNGAGKTTLFNVICGFVSADSGRVRWNDSVLTRHRPHDLARLGIARTLQ